MKFHSSLVFGLVLALTVSGLFPVQAQRTLSLQEALTLASASNPEIRASQLETDKAHQQRVIARSLFLPTVNASALASHYFDLPPFFGFGQTGEDGKVPYGRFGGKDQLSGLLSAVQPLYNPQAFPSLQRSRLQEQDSRVALQGKQVEILSSIQQTYLKILVLNERIKLQKESISRNQRVLQDSKSLFLQGKGLRVDTLRAYTAVKNLEPDLARLSYAVQTTKLQLKAQIGVDSLEDLILTDSLVVPNPGPLPAEEDVYAEAKNNNPYYQSLVLQEQISAQQVRITSGVRKPTLSAVAQYQVQTQTNRFDYGNAYYPSSSFVGLQLSVPLFTGLGNQARVKQAAASRDQSALALQNAYKQLRAQVHEALSGSHEAMLRLDNTAVVKQTAELSYTIVQYRYKKGIASRLELTDAELALSTAQSNYLEAVYDYLSARIVLNRLMGKTE